MEKPRAEDEKNLEQEILEFYSALDGYTLFSKEGLEVKTKLRKEEEIIPGANPAISHSRVIEFDRYQGVAPRQKTPREENYVRLAAWPDKRLIEFSHAQISNHDLIKKRAFVRTVDLILKNLPQGFAVEAPIDRKKTLSVFEKNLEGLDGGKISKNQFWEKTKKDPLIQIAIRNGFNHFSGDFAEVKNESGLFTVTAKKVAGQEKVTFDFQNLPL